MKKDDYIGRRIRQRRWEQGMKQAELAERLKIGTHHVKIFEAGITPVPPSLLVEIAAIQKVPVSHYTEGFENAPGAKSDD